MEEKYQQAGYLFIEANTLAEGGTVESLQAALPKFEQARRLVKKQNEQQKEAICLGWLGFPYPA